MYLFLIITDGISGQFVSQNVPICFYSDAIIKGKRLIERKVEDPWNESEKLKDKVEINENK